MKEKVAVRNGTPHGLRIRPFAVGLEKGGAVGAFHDHLVIVPIGIRRLNLEAFIVFGAERMLVADELADRLMRTAVLFKFHQIFESSHPQGSVLADLKHAGGRLLRRSAERGHPQVRPAGDNEL